MACKLLCLCGCKTLCVSSGLGPELIANHSLLKHNSLDVSSTLLLGFNDAPFKICMKQLLQCTHNHNCGIPREHAGRLLDEPSAIIRRRRKLRGTLTLLRLKLLWWRRDKWNTCKTGVCIRTGFYDWQYIRFWYVYDIINRDLNV